MNGLKSDLASSEFRRAVVAVQKRAEKIIEAERLRDLFVPTDVREQIDTADSQLVVGRRGTGKTHLLRVFAEERQRQGKLAFYIDCTRLGSGYGGLDLPPSIVATKYFTTFLNQLGTELLNEIAVMELPDPQVEQRLTNTLLDGFAPYTGPTDRAGGSSSHYDYAQVARALEGLLRDLSAGRLYIILDEWAQVPFHAQPHLAEFLKRSINIIPAVSLKILAVSYQCQFSAVDRCTIIGMERGADIPHTIDLDKYLVPDERPDFVAQFFAQVLYNHLGVELGWPLDLEEQGKEATVDKLFTQKETFRELVRAAEGNCRDFLCIFHKAYFEEYRRSGASKSVSKPNIVRAATEWFDSEKLANIKAEDEAMDTLAFIMDRVLKGYKSRTFLVESVKAEHPRLTRLLNERVLHKLAGTYSHPDRPGVRHDLLTVDYGAFARFRDTINQVDERVFYGRETGDNYVPVDDKRSIRRITFDPDNSRIPGSASRYASAKVDLPLWAASRST